MHFFGGYGISVVFEGTVGKSLRLGKFSKIHDIFMVGYLCVGEASETFSRENKLWFGRNEF